MARVLLIDDGLETATTLEAILRLAGHDVTVGRSGRDGIRAATMFLPEVALVALRLPDADGLDVIAEMLACRPATRCIVMTATGNLASAIDAIRCGACDYLQEPIDALSLVAAVARAAVSRRERDSASAQPTIVCERHDLARWSESVVRFMSSPRDARTLAEFGRLVGVSTGAFRNWCRTARLSSRQSLLFARALRAVRLHQIEGVSRPQKFLNIVDLRTLSKFVLASGGTRDSLPANIDDFLLRQQHVNSEAVAALRAALDGDAHSQRQDAGLRVSHQVAAVSTC